jgi:hypothetical protein
VKTLTLLALAGLLCGCRNETMLQTQPTTGIAFEDGKKLTTSGTLQSITLDHCEYAVATYWHGVAVAHKANCTNHVAR